MLPFPLRTAFSLHLPYHICSFDAFVAAVSLRPLASPMYAVVSGTNARTLWKQCRTVVGSCAVFPLPAPSSFSQPANFKARALTACQKQPRRCSAEPRHSLYLPILIIPPTMTSAVEGTIITHSMTYANLTTMTSGTQYLVQTNYDPWLPDPPSDPRRTAAQNSLQVRAYAFVRQESEESDEKKRRLGNCERWRSRAIRRQPAVTRVGGHRGTGRSQSKGITESQIDVSASSQRGILVLQQPKMIP